MQARPRFGIKAASGENANEATSWHCLQPTARLCQWLCRSSPKKHCGKAWVLSSKGKQAPRMSSGRHQVPAVFCILPPPLSFPLQVDLGASTHPSTAGLSSRPASSCRTEEDPWGDAQASLQEEEHMGSQPSTRHV
eukprot:1103214-Pelagomonas_calceolata.AAC.1